MLKFNFWLNVNKEDEYEIAEIVDSLKQERTFSKTIRDGIRLINNLRQGKVNVLLELFPWVKDQIASEIRAEQSEPLTTATTLQEQLNRMEQLLLQQGSIPVQEGTKPTQTPIPMLPASQNTDAFELDIKHASRNEDNNSTFNFLISMTLNSQGNIDGLNAEVIEYGVKTGRIPEGMTKTQSARTVPGNPQAMDVPQFEVPEYADDFDLDIMDTS